MLKKLGFIKIAALLPKGLIRAAGKSKKLRSKMKTNTNIGLNIRKAFKKWEKNR
jgi:hypothetical protein